MIKSTKILDLDLYLYLDKYKSKLQYAIFTRGKYSAFLGVLSTSPFLFLLEGLLITNSNRGYQLKIMIRALTQVKGNSYISMIYMN